MPLVHQEQDTKHLKQYITHCWVWISFIKNKTHNAYSNTSPTVESGSCSSRTGLTTHTIPHHLLSNLPRVCPEQEPQYTEQHKTAAHFCNEKTVFNLRRQNVVAASLQIVAAIASDTFRPLGTTTCNTRRYITYSWLLSSNRNSDLQHTTTHNLQLATCPLGIQTCITRQYINYSWLLSSVRTHGTCNKRITRCCLIYWSTPLSFIRNQTGNMHGDISPPLLSNALTWFDWVELWGSFVSSASDLVNKVQNETKQQTHRLKQFPVFL